MAAGENAHQAPPTGSVFSLGWMMAQLFGPLQRRGAGDASAHLPTVSELDGDRQMDLALLQLADLLKPYPDLTSAAIENAWKSPRHNGFSDAVTALHLKLLEELTHERQQLNAYQLGRALSDTCWLPDKQAGADFFLREFNRYRLATLQTWLAQASTVLSPVSAATVSRSLQNWQDWADTNAAAIKTGWDATVHWTVVSALRTQGAAWHALLAGETDTSVQANVDAWIHAGESILRTLRSLSLGILRRFWPVVIVLAAATGGLLYLALADSSGTAKVWTTLATVAAALGVSG